MNKSFSDEASDFIIKLAESFISFIKLITLSHKSRINPSLRKGGSLVIMGNGPSLLDTISEYDDVLKKNMTLSVNFAANTREFFYLRPDFYVLADPVFFENNPTNSNVILLQENFRRIDWPMTLFVPFDCNGYIPGTDNNAITIVRFNMIGVEGFDFLCDNSYKYGRGMPRPRNVLIPSLMIGLWMGYKEIYIVGADHSWTKTLEVDETNTVISVQPHFYEDNETEKRRVNSVYKDVKLHEILKSFHVAFKSYFEIKRFAESIGASIYNSTPGSFIDAFPRRPLLALRTLT